MCLQAKKVVCETCLGNNRFTFTVFDRCDNVVARAQNDKNGNVAFPALSFDRPGVYSYTIRETAGPGRDWVMDSHHYSASVTVTECGSGSLIATISYPRGLPVFVNRYVPRLCPCDIECIPDSGERIYLPRGDKPTCPNESREDF